MRHPNLLSIESSSLLIVDVQEKFRKHIHEFPSLVEAIITMIEASKILKLPVVVTEQYPEGLGATVSELSSRLGAHKLFTKAAFSCCQQEGFLDYLKQSKRNQVIVCGIESHVCVNQSVHDLLAAGFSPHLISEAIGSRTIDNRKVGLEKMIQGGAIVSSVETAIFELLKDSRTDTFKTVQRLVK